MEIQPILPPIVDGEDKSSALKNRIRKNYKHLRKWAKRTGTDSFRVYDRDIKEYPIAIDLYAGRFCVQYFSSSREQQDAPTHLQDAVDQALIDLFAINVQQVFWRSRIRRRKLEQYEKHSQAKEFFTCLEHGVKFQINLEDYLDTGLFLDHRETRQLVASLCPGKRLLNLFAYTSSFSVHAALAGAIFTKSVDLSNTYTQWSRENFALNELPLNRNIVVREDCMKFLEGEVKTRERYDVIVIDPPTISRSKKMEGMFDVQQDYPFLINNALKLLAADGIIVFSTNSLRFQLDESLLEAGSVEEISHRTVPADFQKKRIHRCWMIKKEPSSDSAPA